MQPVIDIGGFGEFIQPNGRWANWQTEGRAGLRSWLRGQYTAVLTSKCWTNRHLPIGASRLSVGGSHRYNHDRQ